jgi:crotonobetainyl-CoA:carnitine CoA-transferase CaiB-like acyl-CoA transferase
MADPLESIAGLKVIDAAFGMSAALASKLFVDLGATVTRVALDGGDPFDAVYPAHAFWREGQTTATPVEAEALLAEADVCVIGGEDYPGLTRAWRAADLALRHPRLIVVDLTGYIDGAEARPAVDLLVQARTGLVNEQLPDRPVRFSMPLPSYGAALMAHVGLWTALIDRERTGKGCVVRSSLQQGAALFWSQIWMEATEADAVFDKLPPKGVEHLIFECADGLYFHFVMGVPGAVASVHRILGLEGDVDPKERGTPTLARGLKGYFADADLMAPAIRKWTRPDILEAFWAAGIPAEPVLSPGQCWDDPQVEAIGALRSGLDGVRGVAAPLSITPAGPVQTARTELGGGTKGPLSGIRVIDLGNFIAGPFASKHLADYGADVIKIEPPGGLANLTGLRNVWVSNRGKRSISVDMKAPEGAAITRRLCEGADVVHHNFRLGVAERLNLDPASLRESRSDLVTLQTRAYGATGPKAARPGFDMVMQALSGHEVRAGGQGNKPMWYRSALLDFATGTLGAIAILVGLYNRSRTGQGADADSSLLNTALFMMSELIQTPDGEFAGAPILNPERTGFHPAEQLYQTRDGWIAVAARTEAMAEAFAKAIGAGDLGARRDWSHDQAALIAERIATFDTDALLETLAAADVWAERCVEGGWARMRDDAQARRQNLVISAPDTTYGEVTSTFGPLVTLSTWTPETFASSPAHGEHTRAILEDLGFDADAISTLYADKIVA